MGRQLPRFTHSELIAAMDEAREVIEEGVLKERPKGFFTGPEYARQHGLAYRNAMYRLERAVYEGRLVRVRGYGHDSTGCRRLMILFGKPQKGKDATRKTTPK